MGTVLGSILDPAADKFLMTTMVVTLAMRDMLPRELFRSPGGFRRTNEWIRSAVGCEADKSLFLKPVPLAIIILGRDVALSISAFYFRYASLPPPVRPVFSFRISCWLNTRETTRRAYLRSLPAHRQKTFKRYWDFSIPSASVHPTQISKYNTFLQLVLVGITTVAPLLPFDLSTPLLALQCVPFLAGRRPRETLRRSLTAPGTPVLTSSLSPPALRRWIVAGTTIWSGLSYVGTGSASAIKYLK